MFINSSVLIGQMGECCDADTVLGKALRVLGQTERYDWTSIAFRLK